MLSRAAKNVSAALLRPRGAQIQQQRNIGDLPVKPNKYIEEWGYHRENLEKEFVLDGTALQRIVIWAIGFPLLVYNVCCSEMLKSDELAGRPKRKLLGYSGD